MKPLPDLAERGALSGLLSPGDVSEFVFTLGGVEYRNWWVDHRVFCEGVTVLTRGPGAPRWVAAPIWWADDLNTAIEMQGEFGRRCGRSSSSVL